MDKSDDRTRRLKRRLLWLRLIYLASALIWCAIGMVAHTVFLNHWRPLGLIIAVLAVVQLYPIQRRVTRTRRELRTVDRSQVLGFGVGQAIRGAVQQHPFDHQP